MSEKISKHKQYGFVYGVTTKTPLGRLAWLHLTAPKESTFPVKDGDTPPAPRYELTLLLSKSDRKVTEFLSELTKQKEEMVALFNEGKKAKIAVDEIVKDGDEMDTDTYPFYAGQYYIVPKHQTQPNVFDSNVEIVDPGAVKGGMPGLCVVRPICTAHGISFQLLGVQLGKDDGVRFAGGRSDAKTLLTALDEGDAVVDSREAPSAKKLQERQSKGGLNLDKLA